ncbi:MAG: hypothetical protein GX107_07290 [Clostridiales bacterium]|jgi:hypothetical protein|nr:hypothetical protein [Clostridiales bacterium]
MKKAGIKLKIIAALTAVMMLCSAAPFITTAAGGQAADTDYVISNPYESVDWESWGQYKANLHCHTIASDGSNDFNEMIEKHYELGYDALSITDHGTTDYSWTEVNTVPLISVISKYKQKDINLVPTPLTQERYDEITTLGEDDKMMIRIPYGIENNPTSFNNAHVNSWFVDYGNGVLGGTSDYERPIKGVHKAGGLSVINHPGEYTGAKKEADPELAYNEDYTYKINKFTNLLLKYDSCIGVDINSKTDSRTKNDRKLWDILIANCVPNGRSVFAICSSDAHNFGPVDSGWTVHCLPSLTVENIRTSMENGAFFGGSRYIKNTKELADISEALGEIIGTSEWTVSRDDGIPNPKVTSVSTSDQNGEIKISATDARLIRWIADGKQIAATTTEDCQNGSVTSTLSLGAHADKIGSYVRAEIFGDGGVLYTQPFTLEYDGAPQAKDFSRFFDGGTLVFWFREALIFIFNIVPFGCFLWKAMTGSWYKF